MTPIELAELRRDMDRRIAAIAENVGRWHTDHRLTGNLLCRSLEQLRASRKLLDPSGDGRSESAAEVLARAVAKAEQHVRDAELHIRRQQTLVEQMRRSGRDCAGALQLLGTFQRVLADHRDALEAIKRIERANTPHSSMIQFNCISRRPHPSTGSG